MLVYISVKKFPLSFSNRLDTISDSKTIEKYYLYLTYFGFIYEFIWYRTVEVSLMVPMTHIKR